MSNVQAVTDFRKRRKENLIRVLSSSCCLCGYNKTNAALEFHHINPEDKKYGIAANGNCHNLKEDLEEVHKCLLVCANCHREIHDGVYDGVNLWKYQIINEDFENQLLSKNSHEEKALLCSKCGAPITRYSKSGLCQTCVRQEHIRATNKPDRDTLKQLIRTTPFTTIANMYEVSEALLLLKLE